MYKAIDDEYVLEGYSNDFSVITFKYCLNKKSLLDLKRSLGWISIEINHCYANLTKADGNVLKIMNVGWEPIVDSFIIRPRNLMDSLSYDIHTGKELSLMLSGVKPLSAFSDTMNESFSSIPESLFEPYVNKGRIIKNEFERPVLFSEEVIKLRYVLYSLLGEEWRMDEYMKNIDYVLKFGCNEHTEEREGVLLGYTDEQNKEYLSLYRSL